MRAGGTVWMVTRARVGYVCDIREDMVFPTLWFFSDVFPDVSEYVQLSTSEAGSREDSADGGCPVNCL